MMSVEHFPGHEKVADLGHHNIWQKHWNHAFFADRALRSVYAVAHFEIRPSSKRN